MCVCSRDNLVSLWMWQLHIVCVFVHARVKVQQSDIQRHGLSGTVKDGWEESSREKLKKRFKVDNDLVLISAPPCCERRAPQRAAARGNKPPQPPCDGGSRCHRDLVSTGRSTLWPSAFGSSTESSIDLTFTDTHTHTHPQKKTKKTISLTHTASCTF